VHGSHPEYAWKIIDMLLEEHEWDVLEEHLNPIVLEAKVSETMQVLKQQGLEQLKETEKPHQGAGYQIELPLVEGGEAELEEHMRGACLYPFVYRSQPEHAGKIIGMLLELEWGKLQDHLQSSNALEAMVNKAMQVLEQQWLGQLQEAAQPEGDSTVKLQAVVEPEPEAETTGKEVRQVEPQASLKASEEKPLKTQVLLSLKGGGGLKRQQGAPQANKGASRYAMTKQQKAIQNRLSMEQEKEAKLVRQQKTAKMVTQGRVLQACMKAGLGRTCKPKAKSTPRKNVGKCHTKGQAEQAHAMPSVKAIMQEAKDVEQVEKTGGHTQQAHGSATTAQALQLSVPAAATSTSKGVGHSSPTTLVVSCSTGSMCAAVEVSWPKKDTTVQELHKKCHAQLSQALDMLIDSSSYLCIEATHKPLHDCHLLNDYVLGRTQTLILVTSSAVCLHGGGTSLLPQLKTGCTVIDAMGTKLSQPDLDAFLEAATAGKLYKLQILNLSGCGLSSEKAGILAQALPKL